MLTKEKLDSWYTPLSKRDKEILTLEKRQEEAEQADRLEYEEIENY